MTPERAEELLTMESTKMPGFRLIEVGSIRNQMTDDEHADVCMLWDTMPGHTSFFNALQRIARG